MELPQGKAPSRRDFWIHHIEAAAEFEGTFKEYCHRHGLKPSSLNVYRKKLGYSKPRSGGSRASRDFVPVKVSNSRPVPRESANLPDPIWLAQFLKAWGNA